MFSIEHCSCRVRFATGRTFPNRELDPRWKHLWAFYHIFSFLFSAGDFSWTPHQGLGITVSHTDWRQCVGLKAALCHLLFPIYLAQMHTAFYFLILCSKLSFPWLISSSVSEILILLSPLQWAVWGFFKKITIRRQQQPPPASLCLLRTGHASRRPVLRNLCIGGWQCLGLCEPVGVAVISCRNDFLRSSPLSLPLSYLKRAGSIAMADFSLNQASVWYQLVTLRT